VRENFHQADLDDDLRARELSMNHCKSCLGRGRNGRQKIQKNLQAAIDGRTPKKMIGSENSGGSLGIGDHREKREGREKEAENQESQERRERKIK